MLVAHLPERAQRAFPVVAWFVGIDSGRVEQLAGAIHDRHLHAGADAGIEPHGDALTSWRGEQQVVQVASEYPDRFRFGLLAQSSLDVELEGAEHLDLPRPADGFGQPRVCWTTAVLDPGPCGDTPFRNR